MQDLISIVVPIYNVERYLNRCVDSILAQTFTNFEFILVDDGSPDNCGKICDYYAMKDSRIKVIHKMNGVLSEARNFGIDSAKGEYICFVDSDDFVHKQYLEIGNNVWLGAYSRIMKGAYIKDGCIVGLGSTVTSENQHDNSIIVGTPAVEKKMDVHWDRGEFPFE